MNAQNINSTGYKLAMFGAFLFGFCILLSVPILLMDIHQTRDSQSTTTAIKPINQRFWSELNQVRQLAQIELSTFSNPSTTTPSSFLRKNAQLHFRKAMETLPSSTRNLSGIREIHAEIENDLELLQLEKNIIRKLAAQQIIIGINRMERLIKSTHHHV